MMGLGHFKKFYDDDDDEFWMVTVWRIISESAETIFQLLLQLPRQISLKLSPTFTQLGRLQ